jgi:hypothetical protein
MSQLGHERRPFKWRLLDNFRYSPGSDRGRVAAQYVAEGPQPEVAILFDHLVGTTKQRRWQFEAKRFRCPQVDHQFELGRYLNWQFIRLRASKNAIHVEPLVEIKVREIGSIRE